MQETWVQSLGSEGPLEKESILDWRNPWTEDLARLQSMGSQRIRYDWATNIFTFISQVAQVVKNPSAKAGNIRDTGSIPESGRSPGEGCGKPLLYSCLENPMNRGAWRATVHEVAKSRMWLSDYHFHFPYIYIYTHTPQLSWPWEPIQTQKLDWWRFKHQTYRTGYMERFPWWLSGNLPAMQETRVWSLSQ